MIVAWTFMAEEIDTESDLILPRYETEELARQQAQVEAERHGVPQVLCKVSAVARYRRRAG